MVSQCQMSNETSFCGFKDQDMFIISFSLPEGRTKCFKVGLMTILSVGVAFVSLTCEQVKDNLLWLLIIRIMILDAINL